MLTVRFVDRRAVSAAVALLAVGGCGTLQSGPNTVALPTAAQTGASLQQAPVAGARDDKLVVAGKPIDVTIDPAHIALDGPRDIKIVARHGALIAVSDSYPSRPRGTSLCQAGSETWFRLIDTVAGAERYAKLVDSCIGGAQWGDPPVTIARGGAQITLNLLSEPAIMLTLGEDGSVSANR